MTQCRLQLNPTFVNADFPVVLDTCVLVPAALCDSLLRLAERRLYLPRQPGFLAGHDLQSLP